MRFRNKCLACLAFGALLASGSAMAAVNAGQIHMALSELKLALVKIGVANAMLANPTPPASNAEAHVAAPNQLASPEISAIQVSTGGVINIYFTPAVGVTGGIVQLVPRIVTDKQGKKGVEYTCYSPNIPDIATAAPECNYHAAGG
ncbi:MAG: hypothetical protein ACREP0_01045 [Rhodanobacteraceae bacterium]